MSLCSKRPSIILGRAALVSAGLLLLFAQPRAQAQTNNTCEHGESPDLITGDIGAQGRYADLHRWGTIGGITAYSWSAAECNIGTCSADWFGNTNRHPVIGQNMFRLKDGRFEQLGQSWLKHGFATEDGSVCGECLPPGNDQHLGVNCSDLYVGDQFYSPYLAPKTDVNPYTGFFLYPSTGSGQNGNAIFRRLQVHNPDIDPALNPGAKYFAEVQYINPHDAETGNGGNNASYRRLLVSGSNPVFNLAMTGPTVVGQPAIMAWAAADSSVVVGVGNLVNDGKIFVAAKATYVGAGRWRYEYAVQNLNANKSPLAFSVPYPPGATVTSLGFHDVDYHSGASQSGADWEGIVGSGSVSWKTSSIDTGEEGNPNVLLWGTLYNFRFEVNAAPGTHSVLFGFAPTRTSFPESLSVQTLTPSACDTDGVCDPGESCTSCPEDCALQGGGQGCCGNGLCEPGENEASCFVDCGLTEAAETSCVNGVDEDRDGDLDCFDADCCSSAACDGFDLDGDSHTPACDCNDGIGTVWATPGEIPFLMLVPDSFQGTSLYWQPPADPGGTQLQYDAIRSNTPTDFVTDSICLHSSNPSLSSVTDPTNPIPGSGFYYLVRAKNACPSGLGPLGETSAGVIKPGRTCP